ncbi:MAG: ribonuclease P protein component [Gemmatimonadota bacterium]
MAVPPDRYRLPRSRRITRGGEIRALLRRGKKSRTAHLDVFASASPAARSRVGLVVPRHRHSIVERNLVKRRLREALRLEVLPRLNAAGVALDVLVRARREVYDASFEALRGELNGWLEEQWSHVPSSS